LRKINSTLRTDIISFESYFDKIKDTLSELIKYSSIIQNVDDITKPFETLVEYMKIIFDEELKTVQGMNIGMENVEIKS
jgi:hypothetical protein